MHRCTRLAGVAALAGACVLVGGTTQAPGSNGSFEVTLTCGSQSYDVLATGWAGEIIGSSPRINYIIVTQSYTDETGTHVLHNTAANPGGKPLVTCTYVGPISGRLYTNTGFFTPAGS
jgi:hypothetical protein